MNVLFSHLRETDFKGSGSETSHFLEQGDLERNVYLRNINF